MSRLMAAVGAAAVVATASSASVQTLQPRRIVGTRISSHFEMKGATQDIVHYATLTFSDDTGAPAFTVDFVAQYQGVRPASPPRVVDIVITQIPANDEHPEVRMEADGQPVPLVTRLRNRRSVVASIPFDKFVQLVTAEAIVERAFDTELEFGAGQLRMLRSIAQRWAGQ